MLFDNIRLLSGAPVDVLPAASVLLMPHASGSVPDSRLKERSRVMEL